MGMVMLGFLAFALDVGYLFHEKRMAQAAADAAAVAAAEEVSISSTAEQNAANAAATLNGFNTGASSNAATVTLTAVSGGNYSNSGSAGEPQNWVQATVTQPVSTFFLGAFSHTYGTINITATAIAGDNQSSPTCICLIGTSGTGLNMSNNAKLNASSCGVTTDSTTSSSSAPISVVGSAQINAEALSTAATGWSTSNNVNNGGSLGSTNVVEGVSACSFPMPAVPVDTTCSSNPFNSLSGGGVSYTVGPNSSYGTTEGGNTVCYNGLTVNGNGDTATLNPGIYVINGGTLHFNSGGPNLGGNGVVFYLTNGANLAIDNGANVNLVAGGNTESNGTTTAPSTGVYNNILFYQDPGSLASNNGSSDTGDTQTVSVQGGSNSYFNGAIYAPLAAVTLGNGSGTTITANIEAQSLTMNGGGTLNSTSSSNEGSLNTTVAKVVQ